MTNKPCHSMSVGMNDHLSRQGRTASMSLHIQV